MNILLVEDDRKLAAFITKALEAEGFAVSVLDDGDAALYAILDTGFDSVILDVMIHGRDGLSVVKRIRAEGNRTPVLLCSSRGDATERVEGLNAGADDYLAKPFVLEELIARVRALTRRGSEWKPALLKVRDLSLDVITKKAQRGGGFIELTTREFRLLEYLMQSSGRVCTRMMILEKVWDYNFDPGSNIVDVYIRKLRAKIDSGHETQLLHTVRGSGYIMKEEP